MTTVIEPEMSVYHIRLKTDKDHAMYRLGSKVYPSLNILGSFNEFDYCFGNNYVLDRVEPDTYTLKSGISWVGETLQLVPTLVFTDLREEAKKSTQNIISGILIAISGIFIVNAVSEGVKGNTKSML